MSILPPTTPAVQAIRPFPWDNVPYTNVTPLTMRDAATLQWEMEKVKEWIRKDLVPHVDGETLKLVTAWETNVTQLINAVNTNLDNQNAEIVSQLSEQNAAITAQLTEQNAAVAGQLSSNLAEVSEEIQQVINSTIEVSDPVISGVLGNTASASRGVVAGIADSAAKAVVGPVITVTSYNYPTIDPTGTTDSGPAINQAIKDIPSGGTVIIPRGTYLINTPIVNANADGSLKSLTFDWSAATFIGKVNVIDFKGEYTGIYTATGVTPVQLLTTDSDSQFSQGAQINIPAGVSATWNRNDIIRVFSDDLIPEGRAVATTGENAGKGCRLGQNFTFHSNSGTVAAVLGKVIDTYATNIRVAKYNSDIRISVYCGRARVHADNLASGTSINILRFTSLVNPFATGLSVERFNGPAVSVAACHNAVIENPLFMYGVDNAPNILGYGILDRASQGTIVTNPMGFQVRHLFTDDSPSVLIESERPESYGRSLYAQIINGHCEAPSTAAFDTHQNGYGHTFSNCSVLGGHMGFALRGSTHSLISPRVRGTNWGIRCFTETSSGKTHSMSISDAVLIDVERALNLDIHPNGHPDQTVRETRGFIVNGLTVRNGRGYGISTRNARVHVRGYDYQGSGSVRSDTANVLTNNSEIRLFAPYVDLSMVNSGSGISMIRSTAANSSTIVVTAGTFYCPTSAYTTQFLVSSVQDIVRVDRQMIVNIPATLHGGFANGGWFTWRGISGNTSSQYVAFTGADIVDAEKTRYVGQTQDERCVVRWVGDAARTMAPIRAPRFDGQELVIWVTGGFTLTVDATTGMSTTQTIASNSSKRFIGANGTWSYVAAS
jgi:hypothetical protein